MCGRYTLRASASDLADEFELPLLPPWAPRYNIAPTQEVLAVRRARAGTAAAGAADAGALEPALLRWGLVPSWVEDLKQAPLLINAKSETAATKPAFRAAFQRRRCLVLADGYYEWEKIGKERLPYYHRLKSDRPFAFAGLWEWWRRAEQTVASCTILTTDANELAAAVHDRMPVILPREARRLWLDPEIDDPAALLEVLRPYPADEMRIHRVSTAVNKATHDEPDCIAPLPGGGTLFD